MRRIYGIQYRGRDTNPPLIKAKSAIEAARHAVKICDIPRSEGNLRVDTDKSLRFYDVSASGDVTLAGTYKVS